MVSYRLIPVCAEFDFLPKIVEAARSEERLQQGRKTNCGREKPAVSRRYETGAMLITSNRSVAEWGMVFADPVVATAILDRLLHHSHVLTIRGDSYRLRAKRKSGLIKPPVGDRPPVGSASPRPVTDDQPSTETMSSRWRQFFVTQRGQFRMAFETFIQSRERPDR
jgi:IstB-like ATP binding protein